MSFVKIELPFEGTRCNDCMYVESNCSEQLEDWCGLFEQSKRTGTRCHNCVCSEVEEV